MSRRRRVLEAAERVTGVALRPLAEVHHLEESAVELRGKQREIQDLAYTLMDYIEGQPQEMKAQERRNLAQRARVIWQQDPQYGGTINLLNEFVLGRGIPKPNADDSDVQDVIDEFWDDPDNQRIITTHAAQVRFNTDLSLQSNVFPLVYDDGADGKVKLGLLDHDTVENAVRDPDARLRILYYLTRSRTRTWDVEKHTYRVSRDRNKVRYYEEFRNLQDAQLDEKNGVRKEDLPDIPDELVGRGRVLQVSINRTMEQAFGIPEIARTIRWLTAYNDLMRARVDMAKAAASIIARRKLKGGAAAMQQMASQALLQAGAVPQTQVDPMAMGQAPRPASILEENDWVSHEAFNLNSGSQGAMQDAQMIRSQYSVGTGWPQSYLGDPSATGLSTATTLELRVLKMVEARQQVLEDFIATAVNHQIRRALETGRLERFRPMTPAEVKRKQQEAKDEQDAKDAAAGGGQAGLAAAVAQAAVRAQSRAQRPRLRLVGPDDLMHADDDEAPDGMVARELTFTVSMPSPLRRAMGDLITAVSLIAKTFDPNNSNMELSKTLLAIALGEGLEVEDPAAAVERIFPPGYVDPMVAAAQSMQAQAAAGGPGGPQMPPGSFSSDDQAGFGAPAPGFTPSAPDGQWHPNADNPYGAPQRSQPPELSMQQAALDEAFADKRLVLLHARGGDEMPHRLQEAITQRAVARMAPTAGGRQAAKAAGDAAAAASDVLADDILGPALATALSQLAAKS